MITRLSKVLGEFMTRRELKTDHLAQAISVPVRQVHGILCGDPVKFDVAIKLGRHFNTPTMFWMDLNDAG